MHHVFGIDNNAPVALQLMCVPPSLSASDCHHHLAHEVYTVPLRPAHNNTRTHPTEVSTVPFIRLLTVVRSVMSVYVACICTRVILRVYVCAGAGKTSCTFSESVQ